MAEPQKIPPEVLRAQDYEVLAPRFMAAPVFEHIAGGGEDDGVVAANRAALKALTVTPRMLRDVSQGHTRVSLPDGARPHPIFLAPVAALAALHPQGEIENARGAAAAQAGMIVSTLSSRTLEDIAVAAGPDRWFQLYVQPQRGDTLDLMRRAEAAGYCALVVTVDTPLQAPSLRSQRAGYRPEPGGPANLMTYAPAQAAAPSGESRILQGLMASAPTAEDLDWLIAESRLPVWIKGVLHPDDARDLMARGAAGLIVSNHGGRALDGAPASLQVLGAIRAAVGEAAPVLFDGGIRSGTDIFKAIALGADAVLIGRLQAYALAVAGALGVAHMVKLLREELELCMALAGCATLADVRQAQVGRYRFEPAGGPLC